MSVRFRKNPSLERELLADPQMQAALMESATRIKDAIPRNLPGGGGGSTRPYARKSYVEPQSDGSVEVGTRWRLANIIEWGSRNNPAYAPLRKSVASSGLRFEER